MLRLASTTVGPVSVAVGSNGAAQTVEAYNAGDGSLNLSATSSVAWITPTVQSPRGCTTLGLSGKTCNPIALALNTSSLPAGTTTGIVTVNDPNAADAPQTITVTVAVGSSIPNSLNVYVAP